MSEPIENYALVGDTETCALVGADGGIDWMCLPRFDSEAMFAALLGDERHGRWQIAPASGAGTVERRYRPATLVLETCFTTAEGRVRVIDFMPPREHRAGRADLVRIVEGLEGAVPVRSRLSARFDYGSVLPALREDGDGMHVVAGPQALVLRTALQASAEKGDVVCEVVVSAGERVPFVLSAHPSHREPPRPIDAEEALDRTVSWWRQWTARSTYEGPYEEAVERSLITLKALTYAPTGGIVAAATTSLPEQLGGARNWDYRYCWLRDASLTLMALSRSGHLEEARASRDWLLRAVAGEPEQVQIMYGLRGERRLAELELPWLPGYADSRPVRVGNAAADQFQLDVYGEVLDTAHAATEAGFPPDGTAVGAVQSLAEFARDHWQDPDEGIWEVRGPRRHFTHSKVMAWVAVDRAIKLRDRFASHLSAARMERARAEIHAAVCARAWNPQRRAFVQYMDGSTLDASVLLMPTVGFLPADDERFIETITAIERELATGPFVDRYSTAEGTDGLSGDEGSFLICAFWLVDALALSGRREDAVRNFEQLLSIRNDVGLLAEEYDARAGHQLGNFPQAFSHLGIVSSAYRLLETEES